MKLHHPVARARLGAWLGLAAALWLAAPAGAARVVDVRVGTHPTFTRVVFELDEAAGYRLARGGGSQDPAILVTLDAAADAERLRSGGDIETVQVQGGAKATARIALRKPGLRLKEMILANPPRIVLDVMRDEPAPQAAKAPAPAPKAKPAVEEPEPPERAAAPEPAPEPVKPRPAPEPAPEPVKPRPAPEPAPPERAAAPEPTPVEPKPAAEDPEPTRAAPEEPEAPTPRSTAPELEPPVSKATPEERLQEPPTPLVPAPPETAQGEVPEPPPLRPPPRRPTPAERDEPAEPTLPPATSGSEAGSEGLVERVTADPLLLGAAAGVLVVAVVIVLLVRRRRALPNDVDVSAIVEESEGRVPARGFAMDEAPDAGAPAGRSAAAGGGMDGTLSSLFDESDAPRPAQGAAPRDEFGFTETAAPATGAAAGGLFLDDDASQGDDSMSQDVDLPADRTSGPPPAPSRADGDIARLVHDLERRVAALESKLDDANEAREKLERQVAAQTEELRVQRAAIARTQRALRTMTRADEDKATEPALRDDGETKTRVNV